MAKIFIENKQYEVPDGKNMLEVCLSLGFDLTYFCWHPALHSVGACRQCAVMQYKDENDNDGKLDMACMMAAKDNTRISIEAVKAHDFRAGNIESLMINHPHDCPVCDEGGECHLQDMTVMSGHNYRRYRFKKRTHLNQDLGSFINHEMNRCIQCYRCVRFYKDYAGGKDLDVFAAHDDIYFGRSESGTLENEFSGNLVEVCPTGVFTDKTLKKHYTRKWDLTNAPSVCHQCGLGCNILAGERYGTLRRILTRYNGAVNGYFLCDRGRFGYEYVNSENRILFPTQKTDSRHSKVENKNILTELKETIASAKKVIGIGSPRASLESNFVLNELVGDAGFYAGISNTEGHLLKLILSILKDGKVKTPSLAEAKEYDAVFILGEDVTNTAPMLALSLRQAAKIKPGKKALKIDIPVWNDAATREVIQDATGPVYTATTHSTKLEDIASQSYYAAPDNIARLGFAVAQRINDQLSAVQVSDQETKSLIDDIVDDLLAADNPLIVSGTALYNEAIIQAAADIAYALKDEGKEVGLIYTVAEANSMGLAMQTDQFLNDAIEKAAKEKIDAVFILENDLFQRSNKPEIEAFLKNCDRIVALDSLENQTTNLADFVLPAGTFAEADGTVVNNEGRAQRFYKVHEPENETASSWRWLDELRNMHRNFDAVVAAMIQKFPDFTKVKSVAPDANYRRGTQKIPRETHRFSGRTAMNANIDVSEPKPPQDKDSPLSFTMEGFEGIPPAADTPFYWAPAWNSVQAINKYQIEVGGPLHGGNPGIRLLEPSDNTNGNYFRKIPDPFKQKSGEWLVVPFYHIYGSDELSALSSAVADRIPHVYLALNEKDAKHSGISKEGDKVNFQFGDRVLSFPVKYDNTLPQGIAGIPKGLKETAGLSYPFWMKLKLE